jgi:hypothetical protein
MIGGIVMALCAFGFIVSSLLQISRLAHTRLPVGQISQLPRTG